MVSHPGVQGAEPAAEQSVSFAPAIWASPGPTALANTQRDKTIVFIVFIVFIDFVIGFGCG
jgi:hypothetical protein